MIRRAILVAAAAGAVLAACGDDDDADASDDDVTATCDAVEALGNEIAALPDDASGEDVVAALAEPVEVFGDAADDSGDDVLEELADRTIWAAERHVSGRDAAQKRKWPQCRPVQPGARASSPRR